MLDGNLNFFRRRKGHFLVSKINERFLDSDRVGKEDKFRFDLKPFWSRESRDVMEPSRIPTVKLKIAGKVFLKSETITSVTFKL